MRPDALRTVALGTLAALALVGCANRALPFGTDGTIGPGSGSGDDAGTSGGGTGGGSLDAGSTGGGGGGSIDAGTTGGGGGAPPPTQLVPGNDLTIAFVTDDDQVVFYDPQGNVAAVDARGGKAQPIAQQAFAQQSFTTVFAWENYDQQSNTGSLVAWTAASGAHTVSMLSAGGVAAASKDGRFVLYSDNASSDGSSSDIVLDGMGGPSRTVLAAKVDATSQNGCPPTLAFAGSVAVVATCPAGASKPTGATLTFYDAEKGAMPIMPQSPMTDAFAISPDGTRVLTITPTGAANTLDPATGAGGHFIDNGVDSARYAADGRHLLLHTTTNDLHVTDADGGNLHPLVTGAAAQVLAVSPGFGFVLFSSMPTNMMGTSDLILVSTTGAENPTTLAPMATAVLFGDGFTSDDGAALWYDQLDAMNGIASMNVTPTATGGMTRSGVAQAVWLDYAATGGRVVYNDHWKPAKQSQGRADIELADGIATGGATTLLAAQADVTFALTAEKDAVVYTMSQQGQRGLFVIRLP